MFSAYDYYAGGEKAPLNWVYQGTNYQYIGREFDEEAGINLNYMIGRYYDPKSQLFMSVEPMLNRPAGLLRNFNHSLYYGSPYTYALDNPVCKLDPNGKETRIYSVTVGIFGIALNICLSWSKMKISELRRHLAFTQPAELPLFGMSFGRILIAEMKLSCARMIQEN